MGMTIWIHTLEERNYSKDSDDHSLMCRHSDLLDEICLEVGARKFSEFMDFTEQSFEFDEFDDEGEEPELDPETDLAYGIDDMTWFDAADGLSNFQSLRNALSSSGVPGLDEIEIAGLIEELDNCISILEGTAKRSGKFHLTLVE